METDGIKKFISKIPFFKKFTDHELNKLIGREKVFRDERQEEIGQHHCQAVWTWIGQHCSQVVCVGMDG